MGELPGERGAAVVDEALDQEAVDRDQEEAGELGVAGAEEAVDGGDVGVGGRAHAGERALVLAVDPPHLEQDQELAGEPVLVGLDVGEQGGEAKRGGDATHGDNPQAASLLVAAPLAGVLAYRADINRDLAALRATTSGRANTPEEEATGLALNKRYRGATIAAAAVGTIAAGDWPCASAGNAADLPASRAWACKPSADAP